MKKLLLTLIFALCLFCAGAETELVSGTGVVNTDRAALRGEPTKAAVFTDRLSVNAAVKVLELETNEEGQWFLLEYNGKRGYANAEYIDAELYDEEGNRFCLPTRMLAYAECVCGGYNHVGRNWTRSIKVNSDELKPSVQLYLKPGDVITVEAEFSENDRYPDIGCKTLTHTVTENEINSGFTIKFDVSVEENKGRYAGSVCVWNTVIRFDKY